MNQVHMPKESYQPSEQEMKQAEDAMYPKQKAATEFRERVYASVKEDEELKKEGTYLTLVDDGQAGHHYEGKIKGHDIVFYTPIGRRAFLSRIDGLPLTLSQLNAINNKYAFLMGSAQTMKNIQDYAEEAKKEFAGAVKNEQERQDQVKVEQIMKEIL